jgi:hypothetical protein
VYVFFFFSKLNNNVLFTATTATQNADATSSKFTHTAGCVQLFGGDDEEDINMMNKCSLVSELDLSVNKLYQFLLGKDEVDAATVSLWDNTVMLFLSISGDDDTGDKRTMSSIFYEHSINVAAFLAGGYIERELLRARKQPFMYNHKHIYIYMFINISCFSLV